MKIGIIVYRLNFKGGTQRQALCLARELIRQGHQVTLYSFKYEKDKGFTDLLEGIPIVTLSQKHPEWEKRLPKIFGFFTKPDFFVKYKHKLVGARMLAHLIDPDTDFLNPHGNFSYRVCYYVKKDIKRIPSVWMLNTMPLLTWSITRKLNTDPTCHTSLIKRLVYRVMDWIEIKKFVSASDDIMVLDERGRDTVRDMMQRDCHVVRSGVDVEKFPYCPRTSSSNREVKLLTVAILSPHRRFEDVIEGIRIVHKNGYRVNLSIIGAWDSSYAYYERLNSLIKAYNLGDHIKFLGRVSDVEFIDHYQTDDIFIFCNYMHPWGLAVFEAMACGMPVIVSRSSGASEVLTDRENGLLVAPKDPQDIASAIQTLIDDSVLYGKLSSTGRAFVEKEIGWARYGEEVLGIAKSFTDASESH